MKVQNTSTRLHHVGLVSIIPGESAVIDDAYAGSINTNDLKVLEGPAKPAAAPKAAGKGNAQPAPVAPAVQAVAVQPAPVWAPPVAPDAS